MNLIPSGWVIGKSTIAAWSISLLVAAATAGSVTPSYAQSAFDLNGTYSLLAPPNPAPTPAPTPTPGNGTGETVEVKILNLNADPSAALGKVWISANGESKTFVNGILREDIPIMDTQATIFVMYRTTIGQYSSEDWHVIGITRSLTPADNWKYARTELPITPGKKVIAYKIHVFSRNVHRVHGEKEGIRPK